MVPIRDQFRNAFFNALRFTFRLLPLSDTRRDSARQWFLSGFSRWLPQAPRGSWTGLNDRHRPYLRADGPAIGHVPYISDSLPELLPAKLIAFFLPQFHVIPENDEWWGKGFTEWRNVTRALPQFEGHAQPRLPGDLGYYDLTTPGVMHEQARLAREYGIAAFCSYFYWFGGKTLLDAPLRRWLHDPTLELSLCLCWANENWSRRWDGRNDDILIEQNHSAADDVAFISHVAEYLRDPRYLRVGGKPVLLVYRPGLLPDAAATAERWRSWCRDNGIGEIHLVYVQSFERPVPERIGFDAAVEFPPNLHRPTSIVTRQRLINRHYNGQVVDWRELSKQFQERDRVGYRLYPGVNCGWDNEARRSGKGLVYLHASPRGYGDWLQHAIRHVQDYPASERLVFVNAWNEWAEGAVLEPDARLGYAYLNATRRALASTGGQGSPKSAARNHVVIHAWHLDAFDEIVESLQSSGTPWHLIVTTGAHIAEEIRQRLSEAAMPFELLVGENRGRDILPFLKIANRLIDEGVDVVLKLHTKRSTHLENGEQWRREMIRRLIGGDRARRISRAFGEQPGLGLVAPEEHVRALSAHVGGNAGTVRYLATRLGLASPATEVGSFVAGSMFWARLNALRPLLDAHLDESDFEDEEGQVDGTMAHAIERIFACVSADAGYRMTCADDPEGPDAVPASSSYPYAG
ncbi:MAG TPA: glycoside hydrolase family 99-like domain-containing protein [Pseudoxanthomonas sp.]